MGKRNQTKAAANLPPPAQAGRRGWISALAVAAIAGGLGFGGLHHGTSAPSAAPTIAELAASSFPSQGDGLTTAQRRQAMNLPPANVLPYVAPQGYGAAPSSRRRSRCGGDCAAAGSSAPIPLGPLPAGAALSDADASGWAHVRELAERGLPQDSGASVGGSMESDGLTTAERRARGPLAFSAAAKLGQGIPTSAGSSARAPIVAVPDGPPADDEMTTAQRREMGDAAFVRQARGNPIAIASASQVARAAVEPDPPAAADDSASDGLTIEQRSRLGEAAFAKGVDGKVRAKMWADANAAAPASPPAEAADASSSLARASSSGDGLTTQQRMLLGDKAFRKGVDDGARAKMWTDATAPAAAAPSAQGAVASAAPVPAPSPAASGQDGPAPVRDASPPIQAAAAEPASAMQGFDATHGIEAHGTWEKNSADAEGSGSHGLLMTLAGLAALALALAWGVSAWAQKVKAGRDDGLADLAQEAGEKLDLDRAGPDFSPSPKAD